MKTNENQLFYKKDESSSWEASVSGEKWPESKCDGYEFKHLSWSEFQEVKQSSSVDIESEQLWVTSEMMVADINVNMHIDNDERKVATIEDWSSYRRDLRNYIKGSEISSDQRPVRPE